MIFSDRRKRHLCLKKEIWAVEDDESDEEEFINLAFMAETDEQEASSSTSQVLTTNISDLSRDECKIIIDEMSNELYNLHVSLKSLTKENSRLKGTIESIYERNSWLENELVAMERLKTENQDSREELVRSLQREKSLSEELRKEQNVIKSWNNSSRKQELLLKIGSRKLFLILKALKKRNQKKGTHQQIIICRQIILIMIIHRSRRIRLIIIIC